MVSTNNVNIAGRSILSSPGQIRSELPLSIEAAIKVARSREEICNILDGKSNKLMMIVGPCSIHDPDAALEYAGKLKELADKVSDRIFMVMRVYFEKPRTTIGWKGLINDPDINGSYNIDKELFFLIELNTLEEEHYTLNNPVKVNLYSKEYNKEFYNPEYDMKPWRD